MWITPARSGQAAPFVRATVPFPRHFNHIYAAFFLNSPLALRMPDFLRLFARYGGRLPPSRVRSR